MSSNAAELARAATLKRKRDTGIEAGIRNSKRNRESKPDQDHGRHFSWESQEEGKKREKLQFPLLKRKLAHEKDTHESKRMRMFMPDQKSEENHDSRHAATSQEGMGVANADTQRKSEESDVRSNAVERMLRRKRETDVFIPSSKRRRDSKPHQPSEDHDSCFRDGQEKGMQLRDDFIRLSKYYKKLSRRSDRDSSQSTEYLSRARYYDKLSSIPSVRICVSADDDIHETASVKPENCTTTNSIGQSNSSDDSDDGGVAVE